MSEFRLPRLPRDFPIAGPDGKPSQQFQRWWQNVVTTVEAQEAIQDQALIDIQTALTNAGIALDNANAIMKDIPPVTVAADYTGTVLAGQLPRNISATRLDGATDVTASSAWSASLVSGSATFTIGAATGVLNVTALGATSVVEVTSVYEGISRSRRVMIARSLQDPPPSSGSTSAYDSSITETTSASYGSANAGPLTITCGASGEVDLSAPLETTTLETTGAYHAYGKWRVSPAGAGTWTDVGTEIKSSVAASNSSNGTITVNQTATGLTASSSYDFQLLLRNDSGTSTLYYAGTATAITE